MQADEWMSSKNYFHQKQVIFSGPLFGYVLLIIKDFPQTKSWFKIMRNVNLSLIYIINSRIQHFHLLFQHVAILMYLYPDLGLQVQVEVY